MDCRLFKFVRLVAVLTIILAASSNGVAAASQCTGGQVPVGSLCAEWWHILLAVVAVAVAIAIILCVICCCCPCCAAVCACCECLKCLTCCCRSDD